LKAWLVPAADGPEIAERLDKLGFAVSCSLRLRPFQPITLAQIDRQEALEGATAALNELRGMAS